MMVQGVEPWLRLITRLLLVQVRGPRAATWHVTTTSSPSAARTDRPTVRIPLPHLNYLAYRIYKKLNVRATQCAPEWCIYLACLFGVKRQLASGRRGFYLLLGHF